MHCSLMQRLSDGQSLLLRHPTIRHTSRGFPRYPLKHLHSATLFRTKHSAFTPQGSLIRHGEIQLALIHALSDSHSELLLQPTVLQEMSGFPSYPSRQEQIARCPLTVHSAFVPQLQGFRHWLLMQASTTAHSLSAEHPILGRGMIFLHSPLLSGTIDSGHEQIIVLTGSESKTSHLEVRVQGVRTAQGFLQALSMQASFDGQSPSVLHSGSGSRRFG